jgi:hypothetical protein
MSLCVRKNTNLCKKYLDLEQVLLKKMMRRLCLYTLLWMLIASVLTGCDNSEIDFPLFCTDFKASFYKIFPDETPLDAHNLQLKKLFIPSKANMDSVRLFGKQYRAKLKLVDTNAINAAFRPNYFQIQRILKNVDVFLTNSQINPAAFNCHVGFHRIIKNEDIAPAKRAEILIAKLHFVPTFYENARKNVKMTTIEQAELAVNHQIKAFLFFDKELPEFIAKSGYIAPETPKLLEEARLAIKDYIGFCNSLRAEAARRTH